MKIELEEKKAKKFIDVMSGIGNILSEAKADFRNGVFEINEIDSANICAVLFKTKPTLFTCLSEDEVGSKLFGLDLPDMISVLKRCSGTTTLEFADKLKISSGKKSFSLPILTESDTTKDFTEPNLNPMMNFKLKLKDIKVNLGDAEVIENSDTMRFVVSNGIIETKAYSQTKGSYFGELGKAEGEGNSNFSLEYLNKIFSTNFGKECIVYLGTDYPIKVTYDDEDYTITFILAPRIEN